MPTLVRPHNGATRPRAGAADAPRRPLALVACDGPARGARRRERTADALAAVLEEFGMSACVGGEGSVDDADLVVCDIVRPDRDLPAEAVLAGLRGVPVVALVPAGAEVEGLAAELLSGARVLRYDGQPAAQVLHRALAG